jgi:hypothetical protein
MPQARSIWAMIRCGPGQNGPAIPMPCGGACGCVTNAGYEIAFFFINLQPKQLPIGIGTRRAADPMWTGIRTRGLAHPAAPDTSSLLRF